MLLLAEAFTSSGVILSKDLFMPSSTSNSRPFTRAFSLSFLYYRLHWAKQVSMAFRSGEAAMFKMHRMFSESIFSLTVSIRWTVSLSMNRAKG